MAKLLLAYDKATYTPEDNEQLRALLPYIDGIKVGLQAMNSPGPVGYGGSVAACVRDWAQYEHLPVMWDAKLHDIGNTSIEATQAIVGHSINMITFHTSMSDRGIRKVIEICDAADTLALGVTVLTDLTPEECQFRYGSGPQETVIRFVENAKKLGLKGLVCSAQELLTLKVSGLLDTITTVIPGIRPTWASKNDQARVMTPAEAVQHGANYLVVGRPILQPPAGMTSAEAAQRIREEMCAT